MRNCYTYKHIRLDTNEVFYIGIGTNSKSYKKEFGRAYSKLYRSSFWNSVINNTEYQVEIIETNLTKEEACEKETELILQYGRRDLGTGSLVNMTNGGEGLSGHSFSSEHKNNISAALKNRKFSVQTLKRMSESGKTKHFTDTHKKNIANGLIGNKYCLGYKHTDETKQKVSEASKGRRPMLGKKHSEETKQHLSEKLKGRIMSEEHKSKIGAALKGRPGATKGRKYGPMSEERKRNISLAKRKKVA